MNLTMILLIIMLLVLIGVIPAWPHARSWGYGPSAVVGAVVLILLVVLLVGRV